MTNDFYGYLFLIIKGQKFYYYKKGNKIRRLR